MTKRTAILAWGLMAAAVVAIPDSALAQTAQVDGNVQRAESFEAKAESQLDSRNRWDQAAWNYRRAGGLRPIGDPQQARSFAMAGRLSYYVGEPLQAMQDFERAANAALYAGDLVAAAGFFTDAAWVAARGGEADAARRVAEHARVLASAPGMSSENRGAILGRLADSASATPSFSPGIGR